ncbi:hypothetical protein BD770DRAFT_445649 [Pilaira anomala]|nr:hypothetical protein BD770DRAFT_445649 [Pilaira anomala]
MIHITSGIYVLLVISIFLLASQSNALTLCLLKSYMTQLIYSPWFTFTATYCIYKNLMLYQTNLKHVVYITIQFDFQFDFMVPNETMPGSITAAAAAAVAAAAATPVTTDLITKSSSTSNQPPSVDKNLNMVKVSSTTKSEKIPIVNQQRIESEPMTTEWIVVTEKKKNTVAAAATAAAVTMATAARPLITTKSIPNQNKRKPKTTNNRQKKKLNNNKQNKVTNNNKVSSTTSIQTTPAVSSSSFPRQQQSSTWSSIVKQQEDDDLPSLSDTESCSTTSIESPSLSYKDLPVIVQPEKYYSPFSTGFDFDGLLLRSNNHPPHPHHELKQQHYTQQQQQQHKTSILNLLNQTDQVETTITPSCFKYFDEMMMSTSLYPTMKDDHHLLSSFNSNKRAWDAATH